MFSTVSEDFINDILSPVNAYDFGDFKSEFDEVTNYEKWEKPRSKCDPSGRRI